MIDRMKELIDNLNAASKAYYQESREVMSNKEYDALYDELVQLESETGVIMSNSPTRNVGYEVISKLPKEIHQTPIQSLDKTKSPDVLKQFLGGQEGVLSWKLDGLTVVLTYEKGKLTKAVTRGNGVIGELVTNNVKCFLNTPLTLQTTYDIITIRGEAIITYKQFDEINSEMTNPYKNPRNLCSGTIRQLDNRVVKERGVKFIAFEMVTPEMGTISESFEFLKEQGFDVVGHQIATAESFEKIFDSFKSRFYDEECKMDIPTDGLVLRYNDYQYGESLGRTDKFPKHSLAFKWEDETAVSVLTDIEWATSRSGVITPVAIFDPVELEGTTVSRATLHNVSIVKDLQLGIGDEITIYKANMVIPQIDKNLTRSNSYVIPNTCPACSGQAILKSNRDSEILMCTNPNCNAKQLAKFVHFVSRECMNIDGLSEETLKKMLDNGWISDFVSLYRLHENQKACNEMMKFPGMGRKSVSNILEAIERSRHVKLDHFINAMGIPGIGKKQSRQIAKEFDHDCDTFVWELDNRYDFTNIPGVGEKLNEFIYEWYHNIDQNAFTLLIGELRWEVPQREAEIGSILTGKTFVVTGKTQIFKNRKALQDEIEKLGGTVASRVTSKTNFLVNNDVDSASGKNKKAKELGVQIISETELISMMREEGECRRNSTNVL